MKSTKTHFALAILAMTSCLSFATGAAADSDVLLSANTDSIEVADLEATAEQQIQMTEMLWAEVLSDCLYCAVASEIQTTELGTMEVTTVIGTPVTDRRMREFSTFNARETHL